MNTKAYHTLEYDKIIDRLAGYASTDDGRSMCRELLPMQRIDDIRAALAETYDAEARVITCGSTSFSGVKNIVAAIRRLEVGSFMSIIELLQVASLLDAAAQAKAYGERGNRENPDCLDGLFDAIDPLQSLNREIKRCIISEEEIADDASPGLKSIRRQIRLTEDKLHNQLNTLLVSCRSYLQDSVVTERDGRYCLPVRAEYRGNVPGLIHDQSGSGSTYFIEPMPIVQLNNELRELGIKEQKEIEIVLSNLSNEVAQYSEALIVNYKVLTRLDFIFAKAELSRSYLGICPKFNEDGRIVIKKGRHPLLDKKKVVPIDVNLGDTFDLLVITGPNTGGKTVTLKTIGLLTLMGEAGLCIPAALGSELSTFSSVFADIGDEQSIEQSLSTFSAHMTNIVKIMADADDRSLVLFDELGAGTDPTEGAALAMAILSKLHERGIRTAATTHYSELKIFALETPGVENACCEFDVATLRPTYRLLIGVPGKSNAFAISSKLGLSEDIIESAKSTIGQQDKAFEDVISDLEKRRISLENAEAEASRLRDEIANLHTELSDKRKNIEEQREKVLREAREEAREILQGAKDSADKAIRALNKAGVSVDKDAELARSGLRTDIDALNDKLALRASHKGELTAAQLHIGDGIHVISLKLDGTVSTLPDDKGNLFVQLGIMRTQVNISDLELLPEYETSAPSKATGRGNISASKSMTISGEINLVGLHVDEAVPQLEKYLDDAFLAHLSKVRIIHGRGTGALKSAVLSILRKNKHIDSYRTGEYNEGGYGVTIATFK